MSETQTNEQCGACGSSEGRLGYSEAREEMVCLSCVTHLQNHGHYPDEDGPKRSTTSTYELEER